MEKFDKSSAHDFFDFNSWEKLMEDPTWYIHIVPELKKLLDLSKTNPPAYEVEKEKVYDFFERHLLQGTVALGTAGKNWDAERLPIETVVIHHTSNSPGIRESRLSAIELLRLYAPYYANPYGEEDKDIVGKPIWSNHVRDGKQVFYPYHWIIRGGNSPQRLLLDSEIGWHAGKWETNRRSVAICLDGDYETSQPSAETLLAIATLIKDNYGHVPIDRVVGHCEINKNTTCPSKLFLDTEGEGWKKDLLSHL